MEADCPPSGDRKVLGTFQREINHGGESRLELGVGSAPELVSAC